jgi:hypothetical protein
LVVNESGRAAGETGFWAFGCRSMLGRFPTARMQVDFIIMLLMQFRILFEDGPLGMTQMVVITIDLSN